MNRKSYFSYRLSCLIFATVVGLAYSANSQTISTVAGNGSPGFSGDGGPATSAQVYYPWSIAADGAGGFYLGTDYWTGTGAARIRRVNSAGIIYTYAGTGTPGFSGDGGPASAAQIGGATTTTYYGGGVASDAAGNLYISDFGNFRLRKVNTSGIINTIGGNGAIGYSGDGGPATAAPIGYSTSGSYENGIASDPYGNVYFYCWGYNKIRKVDTAGIITTVAGTGTYGSTGDGGPATSATIGYCWGLAADGYGNLFMADYTNNKVRKINSSGIISTYAGNGGSSFAGDGGPATAAQIYYPSGVSVDAAGNLYICNYIYNRVRQVNSSGIISTVAGTSGAGSFSGDGGPATAAHLYEPIGSCVDADGNLYISDYANWRIRKVTNFNRPPRFTFRPWQNLVVCENSLPDSINALLSVTDTDSYQPETWAVLQPAVHGTVGGTYTTTSTGVLMAAHGMTYTPSPGYSGLDTFKMTVCDGYAFDTIAIYVTVNPTPSAINGATSIAVGEYSIFSSTPSGGTWSTGSPAVATIGATTGLAIGVAAGTAIITYTLPTGCPMTTTLNVFPYAGMTISTIAGNGTAGFSGDGTAAVAASINNPYSVTGDAAGNYYIADALNNRIRKVNTSGNISTIAGTGTPGSLGDGGPASSAQLYAPLAITCDATGNLYFADQDNNKIRKISTSGIITTIAGTGTAGFFGDGGQATAAQLNLPTGLTIDAGGNIFIADQGNQRIRKVNTSGVITTVAGNGTPGYSGDGLAATAEELNHPDGVAVDGSGNLYIADYSNFRVRMVNTSGVISTIAGSTTSGYSGDGGPAGSANLTGPFGVAVDALNNIYISDYSNNRVRKINTSGIISTVAGNGTSGYSGDACVATAGMLSSPSGLFVDRSGNLFIADHSNQRIRKVSYNHAPKFTGGHSQISSVCENSVDSLNTLLAMTDIDNLQGETWTAVTGALHGSLAAYYTSTSNGGTVTPVGLYYAPILGYTGPDSFKIMVTDCSGGFDTTEVHITVTPPPSSIVGTPTVCPLTTTLYSDPVGTGYWTSSNTSIATVGSTSGLVTGVVTGTAIITFSPGAGCIITKAVTVNPAPSAIAGASYVCLGLNTTLTDPSTGGSWSTSAPLTAGIGTSTGIVTGNAVGTATITYQQAGCIAVKTISVNPVPAPITGVFGVCAGANTVIVDAGGGGVWSTGTPSIATIDSFTGLVIGVSGGTPTFTYTLTGGCTTTFTLTVSPAPAAIGGPLNVCVGAPDTLTDATPFGIWSYTSLGTPAGTIDAGTGIVTGLSAGTVTISYTDAGGCSIAAVVTVNTSPLPIVGSPVCTGNTTLLTDPTTGGTWSSNNLSIAAVGSSTGIVTGVASGYAFITYTAANGCIATDSVNVNAPPAAISGSPTVCVLLTTPYTDPTPGGTWSSSATSIASVGSFTGTVGGVSAGTATIKYTVTSTGCAATQVVTVNNSPGPITGSQKVCTGSTTLLGNAIAGGTWTSSNPSTASVGASSGLVSGFITGTVTVTYSFGSGCASTAIITVNPLPAVIGGTPTVCIGSTTTLSDVTTGGAWTSTTTANATVIGSTGVVTGVATGTSVIVYSVTATGCTRTATVTVNPLPALIGGPSTVCPGTTILLTDATSGGLWSSLPLTTATVGTTGLVLGVAPGIATIAYTLGTGCARTKPVTVNPLPSSPTGPSNVCVGSSITLTDGGGGTWGTTSSNASVGSLSGIVNGISAGPAVITYTISTGCYVTPTITINPLPSTIGGPSALCAGATITLTDPGSGTWISSNLPVATIGASSGVVSGITTGNTNITYTLPTGCATSTTVTVSSSPLPILGASTVCAGSTTTLSDVIGGGLWTSSNPAAATVGSLSGIVTGGTVGLTTTITYSLGTGCTMTKVLSVTASPAAITGNTNICMGSTSLLNDVTPGGAWSSSLATTASVGTAGLVTGVAAGNATISYTVAGCAATAAVTVNLVPSGITGPSVVCTGNTITDIDGVAGGNWTTISPLLSIGSSTGTITGIAGGVGNITYAIGSCITTRPITVNAVGLITGATGLCTGTTSTLSDGGGGTWLSSTPAVATIGASSGLVTALTTGTTNITYTLGTGCTATTTVTVSSGPSAIAGSLHVCAGTTSALTDLVGGGTWSITPLATATIGSSSGIVTGVTPGPATVTYSLGTGCNAIAVVTVNAAPGSISGGTQVCVGSTLTLSDGTPGGTWVSSNPANASVSASGVVSGITAGTTTISYSAGGCTVALPLTINAAPAPISGPTTICSGLTVTFSNTVAGGAWSSSNIAAAPIGTASGIVTGGTPGSAVITYALTGGCSAATTVSVTSGPGAITGPSVICTGHTATLSDPLAGGTWSSDNIPVAPVGASSGIVTGSAAGTANITYSSGGCTATTTVSVNPPPGPISGGPQVCLLGTTALSDGTPGGTWSSSNAFVASVDPASGMVTGVALGAAVITYSQGAGCSVVTAVTVIPSPSAITGAANLCLGATATLSDASPGGTWGTSNPAVVTITGTGFVTGIAGGTDTIIYTMPLTGCKAMLPLSVIALPAISGPSSLCAWNDTVMVNDTSIAGGLYVSSSVTIINLGGGMAKVAGNAPGAASITYVIPAGCTVTKLLTVNAPPAAIAGNYHVCTGMTSALSDATPGGTWTTGNPAVATVVSGSGLVTGVTAGTTYVTYTLATTGCKTDTVITVTAPPGSISGSSNLCAGASAIFTDPVPGGSWTSSNTAIATAGITSGTVTGVAAGTATITYTQGASCYNTKDITVNPLPAAFLIIGGGSYCAGGAGANIQLGGSQTGVTYQLYNGITAAGAPLSGTGGTIDFGMVAGAGTYTIIATGATSSCSAGMSGTATITANPLPPAFTVTGGGSYCTGATGTHVGLSGSASGISYQLYDGASPSGAPMAGTGSTLDFGLKTVAGTYIVTAINTTTTCNDTMTGSVTITIAALVTPSVSITPTLGDTLCAGVSDTYTATALNGGTTPSYQWKVNGINAGTGASYTYLPANNDVVSVLLTSNAACATPDTNSTSVTMTVEQLLTPTVTVNATPGTTITPGQSVTFTASVANAGISPAYQWEVNGTPQTGATTSTYTSTTLNNGDLVTCVVTSTGQCSGQTGSAHVTIVVNNVGVKVLNNTTSDITVLPNPNKGDFIVSGTLGNGTNEQVALEVTDLLGQVIYSGNVVTTNGKLNQHISLGNNVANGMYLLVIRSENDNMVFHLVVEQ